MAKNELAVVICTEKRGVFFGYAPKAKQDGTILRRARMAVYWAADVKGVLGLAATGPTAACRIGPAVAELRHDRKDVTCVLLVSKEAAAAWEAAPWRS